MLNTPLAPLGPGGLDPSDVFATLPESLQHAFESRDMAQLQSALRGLDYKTAKYHMKRCADSGLWVPDKAAEAELFGQDPADA